MSTIELTTWGHAGIRLERDGSRLAVDPGAYTDPKMLDGVRAVLVTHEHGDHVDPQQLGPAVAGDATLEVWAPASVAEVLVEAGAPRDRVHAVAPGDTVDAAGFRVRVLGGEHALIHPDVPAIANVAYLVDDAVLHPGDSLTPPPDGVRVQVLALPVSAPWLKLAEAVDYARQVAPAAVVPIHDALLSGVGRAAFDRITGGLVSPVAYRRLAEGEAFTVPDPRTA